MITQRIEKLQELSRARGKDPKPSHFEKDYQHALINVYKDLPHWERAARAMAYALTNMGV